MPGFSHAQTSIAGFTRSIDAKRSYLYLYCEYRALADKLYQLATSNIPISDDEVIAIYRDLGVMLNNADALDDKIAELERKEAI